ncbi:MAG: xylan 1,4-beta-xylosidase [Oscillospiraceae bacterium]|nr:xylan 1,4-beta-xylosidase [Oscillospiraceae bacterium]
MARTDDRFVKIYSQGAMNISEIWIDRKTGVNYLFHASGYAGGLTPLLNRDGTPVVTPIPSNYDE